MSAVGTTPSWQEDLKSGFLCCMGGPLDSLTWALIGPFDDKLTEEQCIAEKRASFKVWIKDHLPKDDQYAEISATDDKIIDLFEIAMNHSIRRRADLFISARQLALSGLTMISSMAELGGKLKSKEIEQKWTAAKQKLEESMVGAPNPVKDDFVVVETPANIVRREIKLLEKWKADPSLLGVSKMFADALCKEI